MKIKSRSILDMNLEGKVIVLKEKVLKECYRTIDNRLYRALSGFGCHPTTRGSAVFVKCLGDGEETRYDRGEFEGWLTDEEANELMVKEILRDISEM